MSANFSESESPNNSASTTPDAAIAEISASSAAAKGARFKLPGFIQVVFKQDYIGVLIAIIVITLVIGSFYPNFFEFSQLTDIVNQAVFVALLACGMAFLLAMREIDLSVGSVYGLTSMVDALLTNRGMNPWLAVLIGIALGALLGMFNALIIQWFRLPSIVATLATLSIYRGLDFALSAGQQILGPSLTAPFTTFIGSSFLNIPNPVYIMVAVMLLLGALLHFTSFGYRVRAIGSNPDAAAFSGIPVARTRMIAMMMIGALGGVAGAISLGYFGAADPNLGTGYELLAIAAAVIGGTSLAGGKATIIGAFLGSVLLGVVGSGLVYFRVSITWTNFATGAVILLAVILDALVRRSRARQGPQL